MQCVSIIGQRGTGKTTLLVALAREYRRQGKRVGTIKHSTHPVVVDQAGSDSFKHFHEGEADHTLLVTPDTRFLSQRAPDNDDPRAMARRFFPDVDMVLIEGFKRAELPRVEVFRRAVAERPFYREDDPIASRWIAVVTDDPAFRAGCPVLRFEDTMWLHLLAAMIQEKAEEVV